MGVPLPPVVHGPIFPITPVVHLTGLELGWTAYVHGSRSGLLSSVEYTDPQLPLTDQWIDLALLPQAGDFIIVEQHLVPELSGEVFVSGLPPFDTGVHVLPLPEIQLPTPSIRTPIHTCSGSIDLDGIIPGAWVVIEIQDGPVLLQKHARRGSWDAFELPGEDPLPEGAWINVWQEVRDKKFPSLRSNSAWTGPIQNLGFKNPLRQTEYCAVPTTCHNDLCLDNQLPGAGIWAQAPIAEAHHAWFTIKAKSKSQVYHGYWVEPITAGPPGFVESTQSFPRCNLASEMSKSAPIVKATKYAAPKMDMPLCADSKFISLTGLETGTTLNIRRIVGDGTGPLQEWSPPISSPSQTFLLPQGWPMTDANGPVSFIMSQRGKGECALPADESPPYQVVPYLIPPGEKAKDLKIQPQGTWICSRGVRVSNLLVGTQVSIQSTDGWRRTELIPVIAESMFIPFPVPLSPLPKGGQLYAHQETCNADASSNFITVQKSPQLPAPALAVRPRPGDMFVAATGLVIGASAYVLVDGNRFTPSGRLWSSEVTVEDVTQTISLPEELSLGQSVQVLQYLCDPHDLSPIDTLAERVEKYTIELKPNLYYGVIYRGGHTEIKVDCVDKDRKMDINRAEFGLVTYNGHSVPCGTTTNDYYEFDDPRQNITAILPENGLVNKAEKLMRLAWRQAPIEDGGGGGGGGNNPPGSGGGGGGGNPLTLVGIGTSFLTSRGDVAVTSVQWTLTPAWPGASDVSVSGQLQGGGTITGFHGFEIPANVVDPMVRVLGTVVYSWNGQALSFGLAGLAAIGRSPCLSFNLAFDWDRSSLHPGGFVIRWANGETGDGPVHSDGTSCG